MSGNIPDPEAELERFRAQWRSEVNERQRRPGESAKPGPQNTRPTKQKNVRHGPAVSSTSARSKNVTDYSEEIEPRAYHDLPNKDDPLRIDQRGQDHNSRNAESEEPQSALEHYEKAVEKETQGQLGESIKHYRAAFKLDDGVHEAYKKKHFPPSSSKLKTSNVNPSNAPVTVPGTGHHSLQGSSGNGLSLYLQELIDSFSGMRIESAPPPTDASPPGPCPLGELPDEILTQILQNLAAIDVTAFARLAQVCKRLAFLVLTEESIWKQVAMDETIGFPAMHYDFVCAIEGSPFEVNSRFARSSSLDCNILGEPGEDGLPLMPEERALAFSALTEELLHSTYASSWRQMFRSRPRIRFNGCYISTVNYIRSGSTATNSLSWGVPVHVVTYFRYLRFFPDGTVISLLTTSEPADVVHHLTKDNLHDHHTSNALPSSVMKDALRGRWRMSGPASSEVPDATTGEREREGDVHVETEGVVSKYKYVLLFALTHAGKQARNNKLAWKGFWSYNRLTDDWGEFGLKNDRAFYWSRVRSYATA